MPSLSSADHHSSPPMVRFPRDYNAAHDLIERNLTGARAGKVAYIDDEGTYTYGQLAERVNRAANALTGIGLGMEERVMLCHLDTIDWPSVFLGAIKAGIVPVAVNTLLTTTDYEFMLRDSRARALVVSEALYPAVAPLIGKLPLLRHVIVSGKDAHGHLSLQEVMAKAGKTFEAAPTTRDDACFWLYSSGSTGTPKGTVHVHSSLIYTAELYGSAVLGIRESDVVYSAAKLFFAYGLGNALTFPLAVGATTVLMAERPTPQSVFKRLIENKPTIFYGVPTLYAALLASPELPAKKDVAMRVCTSAGEALPADIGERWTKHFGVEILDGIGSTEMLHIFLSNRPGEVRYGTTGKPVPGYRIRLIGEDGAETGPGEIGELQIDGPSSAAFYWNNREKTQSTFVGAWTRAGDKYSVDQDGYYTYAGRSDDMLKVGGIYVSPFEVEAALMTHPSVLEAAVVGKADEAQLVKPSAYVVTKPGIQATPALAEELKAHVRSRLAPYKYPRWIEFMAELPKTATGKIQRFRLRG
ncbi:MAG: 4-hydroxybenzoate--CoA ligase [Betaproteobacteria bacterium RIFCSPLOWO2_12_FULL_63_13]|nr:MAG: 4-hydroxybenzoate--CoA ligase [Betaproteobacteria bacterium RIFCSPLOWO2_02_FULL_63_19]OGA44862.1 MAG: 4-hydroxybenzoate--CoA ligase [Betaproteobacteria bacterium RIFCSPLOWO2_12_FULL_63_13]